MPSAESSSINLFNVLTIKTSLLSVLLKCLGITSKTHPKMGRLRARWRHFMDGDKRIATNSIYSRDSQVSSYTPAY